MKAVRRLLPGCCLFVACSGGTEIPLEVSTEQLVVVLATVDGRPSAALRRREPGQAFEVESDPETPIFTWVIDPEQLLDPSGAPISADVLASTKARHRGDPADDVGACGRCSDLSHRAPQVINPGDSCPVPAFTKGAVWVQGDDGRSCRGSADGTLCPPGSDLEQGLLYAARDEVRLEWPGECACTGPGSAPSRRNLDIRSITPEVMPAPMEVVTQTPTGQVVGISREASFVFDPQTQRREVRPVSGLDLTHLGAIGTDGGQVLLASESFNTGWSDLTTFHRFGIEDGALTEPTLITEEATILPDGMSYLGRGTNRPLWISGMVRSATNFEPAIQACSEALDCDSATVNTCRRAMYYGGIGELAMLDNGAAVGRSNQVLYLKGARPPPAINPHPLDPWVCVEPKDQYSWRGTGGQPAVRLGWIASMTTVGNRVFVCAETTYENCEPNYAVILTATVAPTFSGSPDIPLQVTYRGGDWSRCRRFLKVPGQRGVRALLSGQRLIDFDEDGWFVSDTDLATAYGPVPSYQGIEQPQPGWLIGRSTENRIYVATGTAAPFVQAYGPESAAGASYDVLIALDDGDFYAFGHPRGAQRVRVTPAGDFPTVALELVPDLAEATLTSDDLRAGALDHGASTDAEHHLLVGGKRGRAPYLARYMITATGIQSAQVVNLPEGLGDVAVVKIAEIGPGNFLVALEGASVFSVRGTTAAAVEIDYDDPSTLDVEARPARSPDVCTRQPPRLDLWRAIGGSHGVGWLVGTDGLVIRVGGTQGTRFVVPGARGLTVTAVEATCPDQVLIGGQGRQFDSSGGEAVRMQFWKSVQSLETPEGRLEEPRDLALERIGELDVEAVTIYPIYAGLPIALFPENPVGSRSERPFAAVLEDGYVHRMFVADRLAYTKSPFVPKAVAASKKGWILFGGDESRLALGVPR